MDDLAGPDFLGFESPSVKGIPCGAHFCGLGGEVVLPVIAVEKFISGQFIDGFEQVSVFIVFVAGFLLPVESLLGEPALFIIVIFIEVTFKVLMGDEVSLIIVAEALAVSELVCLGDEAALGIVSVGACSAQGVGFFGEEAVAAAAVLVAWGVYYSSKYK